MFQVLLWPADRISFVAHQSHDPGTFATMDALVTRLQEDGYYGGVRLLMASTFWMPTPRSHIKPQEALYLNVTYTHGRLAAAMRCSNLKDDNKNWNLWPSVNAKLIVLVTAFQTFTYWLSLPHLLFLLPAAFPQRRIQYCPLCLLQMGEMNARSCTLQLLCYLWQHPLPSTVTFWATDT